MNTSASEEIATELFQRIRKQCDLGTRECFAAIEAIRGGYENRLELKQILRMLWCHSQREQLLFDTHWDEIDRERLRIQAQKKVEPKESSRESVKQENRSTEKIRNPL